MKFGLAFATAGPLADPDLFETLVTTAEEIGMESIWAVEHVVLPAGFQSKYPYNKDGRFPGAPTSAIPDPIVPPPMTPIFCMCARSSFSREVTARP